MVVGYWLGIRRGRRGKGKGKGGGEGKGAGDKGGMGVWFGNVMVVVVGGWMEGEESEREMVGCLVVRTDWVGFEGLEGVERLVIGMDGLIGGFGMEML